MLYLAAIGSKLGAYGYDRGICERGAFGMHHGGFAGAHPFSLFGPLLIFLLLVLLTFLVIKLFAYKKTMYHVPSDKALEILKERYVKGEVSADEFKEMKKNLLD